MTLNLTPESYPIHKRVVVGTFDTSAAGCRLVLLHPKASTDAASARVTVTGLDLGLSPAFGSDWGAIHVFNEKETTFVAINVGNLDITTASHLASALSLFLSAKGVEQIIIPVALQFQIKATKNFYVHTLFSETGVQQFPGDVPINDDFVAPFINFLRLEEIPTTLLITRGHRFSPLKPGQTKEVVLYLKEALASVLPSFSIEEVALTKLKPNAIVSPVETQDSLMYL
eukprot:TRINITY_DN189_c0_g1_i1.p1 TRINITY_DN189_c0_g1~~TRINITY_DN189_c0_g1_i1.p1  ORF type:complete len:238 (+),score=47.82 TRINITY_DN189_c0_g1_i1:33-716(+)